MRQLAVFVGIALVAVGMVVAIAGDHAAASVLMLFGFVIGVVGGGFGRV
jgi:hypothetical protein